VNWMKRLLLTVFAILVASGTIAAVPFKKHSNGDLTVNVAKLTKKNIKAIVHDIPGKQGKCVRFQIMRFQKSQLNDAIMRIPADRPGIEFELHADGNINVVCGRFSEDHYDNKGNPERYIEYEKINGY